MRIEKVIIENFKCFRGRFEIHFKEGMNILVGDNESGKSTILEAIHLALTGYYQGRPIGNELSQYLFNNEVIKTYLESIKQRKPTEPPKVKIEVYFSGTKEELAITQGDNNTDLSKDASGIQFEIAVDEQLKEPFQMYIKDSMIDSLPIEYYRFGWQSFSRDISISPRNIPLKSVLIDSSSYRFLSNLDPYFSKVIKEKLSLDQEVRVSQAHRRLRENFKNEGVIKEINQYLQSTEVSFTGRRVELSVDLGTKNAWEDSILTEVDETPLQFAGKGVQHMIKTELALSSQKADKAEVILLEEPENHLSHSNLSYVLNNVEKKLGGKQIICVTHSSFVANKLGLKKIVLIQNFKLLPFSSLSDETQDFFYKLAGYDTLRFVLCKRAILVEGDSDELILQRAYLDQHNKLPIQNKVEVMSVGTAFLRFLEIANYLEKETVVVTDNDGHPEALEEKYKDYLGDKEKEFIKICYSHDIYKGPLDTPDSPFNYNTLEPYLTEANGLATMNQILNKKFEFLEDLHKYMVSNKTKVALTVFSTTFPVSFPDYIRYAVKQE